MIGEQVSTFSILLLYESFIVAYLYTYSSFPWMFSLQYPDNEIDIH